MAPTRVLVVSDTHLSTRIPEALDNWEAVVHYAEGRDLAWIVHAGDVAADGADHDDDLATAHHELGRLPAPLRAVPGNHDVGDNPLEAPIEARVTAERLERYRAAVGPDRWRVDVPGWRLLGVNSLLFGSGLADEDDQWRWLMDEIAELALQTSPPRLGLVLHKPLVATPVLPTDATPSRYVPPAVRARLDQALRVAPGLVVISGHCHQFSHHEEDGVTHLWIPSTWATIPDRQQPRLGNKVCGVVELRLGDDGELRVQLVQPAGLRQHVIGEPIALPG